MGSMQALPWALDELEMPEIFPMLGEPSLAARRADERDTALARETAEHARREHEAYERGRLDGAAATQAQMESIVASALAALHTAVADVQLHEARWLANIEENTATLAVAVARHIVQHEITADTVAIRTLVLRALAQLPVDQTVTVRLHPEDVAACSGIVIPDSTGRVADVRWHADPHITRGGCLVEGRERIIDGRIDTALERVYRQLGNIQA